MKRVDCKRCERRRTSHPDQLCGVCRKLLREAKKMSGFDSRVREFTAEIGKVLFNESVITPNAASAQELFSS